MAQITDIGIGDEVAKTLGNDKSDREQMNTFRRSLHPAQVRRMASATSAENGGTSSFSQPSEFACHSAVCLPAAVSQAMTR
ncbi:hypothetical protein NKH36_34235 [Mesorhizobium sp. M1312]|uniref:hypothetical protein n=1 Tax=unclassified Mesorhizobium TaxID=325217 RepID=UPI0033390732